MHRHTTHALIACAAALMLSACGKDAAPPAPAEATPPAATQVVPQAPVAEASRPEQASEIPAHDKIDNTAEVEAVAKNASPTQAQIDQYNKDEAEMADKSASGAKK